MKDNLIIIITSLGPNLKKKELQSPLMFSEKRDPSVVIGGESVNDFLNVKCLGLWPTGPSGCSQNRLLLFLGSFLRRLRQEKLCLPEADVTGGVSDTQNSLYKSINDHGRVSLENQCVVHCLSLFFLFFLFPADAEPDVALQSGSLQSLRSIGPWAKDNSCRGRGLLGCTSRT